MRDKRYTLTREFTGSPYPMWVARFCGDWIGQARSKIDAAELIANHADRRAAELEIA